MDWSGKSLCSLFINDSRDDHLFQRTGMTSFSKTLLISGESSKVRCISQPILKTEIENWCSQFLVHNTSKSLSITFWFKWFWKPNLYFLKSAKSLPAEPLCEHTTTLLWWSLLFFLQVQENLVADKAASQIYYIWPNTLCQPACFLGSSWDS